MPKEMLPIVDKPLIQYAVEEAVAAGIEHIVLVTHRTKRAIEDHFDASQELEKLLELQGKHALLYELRASFPSCFSLTSVRQNDAPGLGHALLCARHLLHDEPFAVVLPDDLMQARNPVLSQMVQQHRRFGGSMVAVERPVRDEAACYGLVDTAPLGERVQRVVAIATGRRPGQAPASCGLVGRYILSPAIFDALAESAQGGNGELELADGLSKVLEREPVFAYRFEGRRFDCSSKLGFLEATVNFALNHTEVGEAFAGVLGRLGASRAVRAASAASGERTTPVPSRA
jgi:UTP--glucose-1-phosphate uridylyltransferase